MCAIPILTKNLQLTTSIPKLIATKDIRLIIIEKPLHLHILPNCFV